ncbi:MAG: hypothetical protein E7Z87_04845 [Cyanobacteria bacterium SIG26]|nr:hypothetical protein [Cyanobacteria bacterium SIG26]
MDLANVQKLKTYDECYTYLNQDFKNEVTHARNTIAKAKTYSTHTGKKLGITFETTTYYDENGNSLFEKCVTNKKSVIYSMTSTDGKQLYFKDFDGDGNIDFLTKNDCYGENYWAVKDRDSNGEFDIGFVADGQRFGVYGLRLNINFKYY